MIPALIPLLGPLLARLGGGAAARGLVGGVAESGLLGRGFGMAKLASQLKTADVKRNDGETDEEYAKRSQAQQEVTNRFASLRKSVGENVRATIDSTKKLHAFAEGLTAGNEHLAHFNGKIAAAYARLQLGDIKREIHTGKATAGTASALADATNEMRDAWAEVGDQIKPVINLVGWIAAKIITGVGLMVKVVAQFSPIVKAAQTVENWLGSDDTHELPPGAQFLQNIYDRGGQRQRPPIQGGP